MKFLTILLIIILLFILVLIRYGGILLVKEDNLEGIRNASIVLLMGSVADRTLGAAKLYKENVGKNIIMVRSYIAADEILDRKGISIIGHTSNSKLVLSKLNVDNKDIIILPDNAKSTKDEALAIYKYVRDINHIESIVIVTSKYHSLRSKLIFKKVFNDLDVNIFAAPTPFDSFNPKEWYKNREDAKNVVKEYTKLTYYLLFEQFKMKK